MLSTLSLLAFSLSFATPLLALPHLQTRQTPDQATGPPGTGASYKILAASYVVAEQSETFSVSVSGTNDGALRVDCSAQWELALTEALSTDHAFTCTDPAVSVTLTQITLEGTNTNGAGRGWQMVVGLVGYDSAVWRQSYLGINPAWKIENMSGTLQGEVTIQGQPVQTLDEFFAQGPFPGI